MIGGKFAQGRVGGIVVARNGYASRWIKFLAVRHNGLVWYDSYEALGAVRIHNVYFRCDVGRVWAVNSCNGYKFGFKADYDWPDSNSAAATYSAVYAYIPRKRF